jgi:hypothetical protein
MILTSPAVPEVIDARVVTFKTGVLNRWDRDHVQILNNSFNSALFAALIGLCAESTS